MVVKMKKLELLLYHKEREQFLESLRSLGVIHITDAKEQTETPRVQELQAAIRSCERTVTILKQTQKNHEVSLPQACGENPENVIQQFEKLEEQKEKIDQELNALRKDAAQLEPWGMFNPGSVKQLSAAGVRLRFMTMAQKQFDILDKKSLPVKEINRVNAQVFFVVIDRGEPVSIEAEEVRLPEFSILEIKDKIKELEKSRLALQESEYSLTVHIDSLESFKIDHLNLLRYEQARLSMQHQASGKLLKLSGWFPAEREQRIKDFLKNFPLYFDTRAPLPNEDVPVQLKNSRLQKLFEPITGLYSLPLYNELDITPFMAPFFAFFFGLCLGDLGYGLIVLTASLIARFKVTQKLKPFMSLGIVLGAATSISGVLLNSLFGQPIFGGPGVTGAFLSSGVQTFAPLSSLTTENGVVFPAMSLALLLGFIQLLFGMCLQAYVKAKYGGFKASLQPIASMLMVIGSITWAAHANFLNLSIGQFTVGPVQVGAMLLDIPLIVAKSLTLGGLLFFFLFNNIDKNIFLRPLTGLWEFYQFSTGLLGNILSYLRLFALGLAGGLLGAAFNQIAFMFITKDGNINYASWGLIGTIAVLILGHSLNLALSALGSFVHPLRLTFVEFYGAIQFKGGSKPYVPFVKIKP